MNSIKQAVIFAGGQGTRLRPLTDHLPKPMVPINGKPFLEYLVELLRDNGIQEIVMLLGYLPAKITDHFGDGKQFNLSIKYSIGKVDDLTGTRIRNAAPLLAPEFLLIYGDNYWPMNLDKLVNFYHSKSAEGTLAAYANTYGDAEHGREKNLRIEADGRITRYSEFSEDTNLNGVDMGFFLMRKEIVQLMPEENFSFEQLILPKLIQRGSLFAYLTDQPYCAITKVSQLPEVAEFLKPKRVIFLDRDGVINQPMPPHTYVTTWGEFKFLPGALSAIARLTQAGYQIYLVTNQQGIAKGVMSEADLANIHQQMTAEIASLGGQIADIYYCPHSIDDGCDCRKPKPGLLFRAAREHKLDLTKAIFIGDTISDQQAGESAGCRTIVLAPGDNLLDTVNGILSTSPLN